MLSPNGVARPPSLSPSLPLSLLLRAMKIVNVSAGSVAVGHSLYTLPSVGRGSLQHYNCCFSTWQGKQKSQEVACSHVVPTNMS